jgi:hypothetical protein
MTENNAEYVLAYLPVYLLDEDGQREFPDGMWDLRGRS